MPFVSFETNNDSNLVFRDVLITDGSTFNLRFDSNSQRQAPLNEFEGVNNQPLEKLDMFFVELDLHFHLTFSRKHRSIHVRILTTRSGQNFPDS